MAEVPYTGVPSVSPDLPATPGIRPNISADAFGLGIAQASERAGATLGATGNELFNRAYAMQELDQQADAIHAHAKAVDEISEKKVEFHSKLGADAKNSLPQFQADINNIVTNNSKGLSSDYARTIYDSHTQSLRSSTLESAALHAADQYKQYQIGTTQSEAEAAIKIIGMNPDDEEVFQTQLKRIAAAAGAQGALQGKDPQWTNNHYNDLTSQAVDIRARALAERGDTQGAQKVLDDAWDTGLVAGDVHGKVDQYIRTKRWDITGRNEAERIINGETLGFGESMDNPMEVVKYAVGKRESSNNYYNRNHPKVHGGQYDGQRAIGYYGIMPGNVAEWSRLAGIEGMTPEKLRDDPEAQDKIFMDQWRRNRARPDVHSDNEAAVLWFGGEGALKKYHEDPKAFARVNDGHTSGPTYLRDFNKYMAEKLDSGRVRVVAEAHAKDIAPNDPEFPARLSDVTATRHATAVREQRQEEQRQWEVVKGALLGDDKTGKLPTSNEDITDPEFHRIVDNNPKFQDMVRKVYSNNAKNLYKPTDDNQAEYRAWLYRLEDQDKSEKDINDLLDMNFTDTDLPRDQATTLYNLQQKLRSKLAADPPMARVHAVMKDLLNAPGVNIIKGDLAYDQIMGEMTMIAKDYAADYGKPMDQDTARTIGGRLLVEKIAPKYLPRWVAKGTMQYEEPIPDEKLKAETLAAYQQRYPGTTPSADELQRFFVALQMVKLYSKKVKTDGQ